MAAYESSVNVIPNKKSKWGKDPVSLSAESGKRGTCTGKGKVKYSLSSIN